MSPLKPRLKPLADLFERWRDRIVIVLIAIAFVWLAHQQRENHGTAVLAHGTAVEAKGTADEAKTLAIISSRESERLNGLTITAQAAYCKLKLYDEISGIEGGRLFARLGVLPPHAAAAVRAALRLVASIPSPKKCDSKMTPVRAGATRKRSHRAPPVTSAAIERFLRVPEPSFSVPLVPAPRPRGHRVPAPPPRPVVPQAPRPAPAPVPVPVPRAPVPEPPPAHPPVGGGPPGQEKPGKGPLGLPCPALPALERLLCEERAVRAAHDTAPVHRPKGAIP